MPFDVAETRLLDRIFETSPTGIVVLTPEGEITRCNQRAEELLALEESAIEGQTYAEPEWTFVDQSGDPIPESEHPFVQVRSSRGPIFSQEFRLARPHAEPIDLSISGAPIMDEAGDVERLVFAFEDITELRARERELTMMTEQLEVLNRVVRHDIRNDMAVVLGWLETVEAEVESEQGLEAIDRITRASQHVIELTETARDLVDVVTDEVSMTVEPVRVEPVLRDEVLIARESYPEATIEIDGELPDVAVEATDLLGSVLRNLLNNAIQHNDSAEPRIEITVNAAPETVHIEVADNGPGVPEGQKWSIFGKGEKGLESTSTGIGLYLVETLVSQFGGDVWVEDNEPRGAVFIIELQRAE